LIGRGSNQVLRYLGDSDVDFIPGTTPTYGFAYFVHKWVSADTFQIWVLI
jgi:hypothetical protein